MRPPMPNCAWATPGKANSNTALSRTRDVVDRMWETLAIFIGWDEEEL
jgi:hypothetical protein